jgi:hypothetical protein
MVLAKRKLRINCRPIALVPISGALGLLGYSMNGAQPGVQRSGNKIVILIFLFS